MNNFTIAGQTGLVASSISSVFSAVGSFEGWLNDHQVAIGLIMGFVFGMISAVSSLWGRAAKNRSARREQEARDKLLDVSHLSEQELRAVLNMINEITLDPQPENASEHSA